MFWTRNKELISKEAELLLGKLTILERDVSTLRFAFDKLETNYNSLRGILNRKLGGSKSQNLTAESDDTSELDKQIEDAAAWLGIPKEKIKNELNIR